MKQQRARGPRAPRVEGKPCKPAWNVSGERRHSRILADVRRSQVMETSTIEVGFKDDAAVEAFCIADGILTKGQAVEMEDEIE